MDGTADRPALACAFAVARDAGDVAAMAKVPRRLLAVNTRLRSASRSGPDGTVTLLAENGRSFTGDEVLVAAGRAPATGNLGLGMVGLTAGRFIDVDATGGPAARTAMATGDGS